MPKSLNKILCVLNTDVFIVHDSAIIYISVSLEEVFYLACIIEY